MNPLINYRQLNSDLTLHIYKKKCFYDSLWSPETIEARGVVKDASGVTITRPFQKVFNYMENGHRPFHRDEEVIAMDKVNGFFLAVSLYKDDLLLTCKGSWNNEFTDMGREALSPYWDQILSFLKTQSALKVPVTLCYEICNMEKDPHIIAEKNGCYLLGIRNNETGELSHPQYLPRQLADAVPSFSVMRFGDVIKARSTYEREGWVCYSLDMTKVCKVKSLHYLTKKFFSRMNMPKTTYMFSSPQQFKRGVDEEFGPIADKIVSSFTLSDWLKKSSEEKLEWMYQNL